jgi:hypothetical protein
MKNEIKKLFKNFDENSGWRSIVKFIEYVNEFESKKNNVMIKKLYEEFDNLDNSLLIKNFSNFKKFCLSK